jgi:SpoVK/Ycf46/Vps4 family AAA+-type ATPase
VCGRLLVGPSGTGKTLAASWVATRLGLPLYRVDLASVTSKYIGETEKNLSDLFARAEHAEVRAALRRSGLAVRQAHRRQGCQ